MEAASPGGLAASTVLVHLAPTAALLRFHLGAGVRLAVRAGVPAAALLTVAIGLSGAPDAVLRFAATGLAAGSGSLVTPLVLAAIGAGMAAWGAPRTGHGAGGWLRHLPAGATAHGLGLLGALMAAQSPVGLVWLGLWAGARFSGLEADPRRLAALPVVLAGTACMSVPGRARALFAAAGVTAVALALGGGWVGIAVGALLAVGAMRFFVPRPPATFRGRPEAGTSHARWIPERIASRAVGWRVLSAWIPGLLLFVMAALIVGNNPEFDTRGPLRMVGTWSIAVIVASLADSLAGRRPPWRWARSLPWSGADRVRGDAGWFAAHAVVVPAAIALLLDPAAGFAAALTVPLLSVRAAAALRHHQPGFAAYGRVVGEGVFLGLCLLLSAWAAAGALLLTWPAWRDAARRDRDLDISRWSPREHLAVGDPASWRGG